MRGVGTASDLDMRAPVSSSRVEPVHGDALSRSARRRGSWPRVETGPCGWCHRPERRASEEVAQIDDVVVETGHPEGLAAAVGSAQSTGASPREERLDALGTVELIEPGEARVDVGEPTGKHPPRLIRICAVEGSTGRGDDLGVAQRSV